MAAVEFYFDYSCPWTCLAFTRLREAAMRTGSTIVWCPIRVDRVRHEINPEAAKSRQDPEPRKALYQAKDLNDWAIYCDLTIQIPDDWPPDTELALSGAVLANEAGLAAGYSEAIFRAYFAQRQDISQMETVCAIAESVGLTAIASRLADAAPAQQVRANEAELLRKGGFGSPTMFVGEAMFFGNDRMPLVEYALGQASGRTFVMPGQHG
jgi:2-hydroxychromene-2-carboxylate isomerase